MSVGGSQASLGTREIRAFYSALEVEKEKSWADKIAIRFSSDQETEIYKWLSAAPALEEWISGREAKGLSVSSLSIKNKEYAAMLHFRSADVRRDKTGVIDARISDLARRTVAHYTKLLSLFLLNGTGDTYGLCYDEQYYFDTDHEEGDSGSQKNLLTASEVAKLNVTTATDPTPLEAAQAVLGVIAYMIGLKDSVGEYINEHAKQFLVMTGKDLGPAFSSAVTSRTLEGGTDNPLAQQTEFKVRHVINPHFSSLTTQFQVFRTDAPVKSMIIQEEVPLEVEVIGKGSEHEIKNREQLFGVSMTGGVGYGMWQNAAHATLS